MFAVFAFIRIRQNAISPFANVFAFPLRKGEGRTIRKRIGERWRTTKKYLRKGKLNEKKFRHAN